MRSTVGRVLIALFGGFAVVAASFGGAMAILHYGLAPHDPDASVIHVVQATYGDNCRNYVTPAQFPNWARPGNVTAAVATACDKTKGSCLFIVDVTKLGDPAHGCGKEFAVTWRCGSAQMIHEAYLPAEAYPRTALLNCEKW
jgi:hypothetical protein